MVEMGTLAQEHRALVALYGQVQARCSAQLREQAWRIDHLEAEVMRLRAAVIVQKTALAYAGRDRGTAEPAGGRMQGGRDARRRLQVLVDRLQALLKDPGVARA